MPRPYSNDETIESVVRRRAIEILDRRYGSINEAFFLERLTQKAPWHAVTFSQMPD
jgi:hypothetical protein